MKYYVKTVSSRNEVTAKAILGALWGSFNFNPGSEWDKHQTNLDFAIERHATLTSADALKGMNRGFNTKRDADTYARSLRRSIDIGQGMMVGSGLIQSGIFDRVEIVRK